MKKDEPILSAYQPSGEEKERLMGIRNDYATADELMKKSSFFFDGRNVKEERARNHKFFNIYHPESQFEDPNTAWQANTTRPIVRNKIISIAAHVVARIIYPAVFAQNDKQEIDKTVGKVVEYLLQYYNEKTERYGHGYEKKFMAATLQALVEPVSIVHVDFAKIYRKIRDKGVTRKVLDEVMSGLHYHTVASDDLLIENNFESNVQKQGYLIRRSYPSYTAIKQKYAGKQNIELVKAGIRVLYDDKNDIFIEDSKDITQNTRVEEIIYYNRLEDLEVSVVNGIIIGDYNCPLKRADKLYPFATSGYQPINNGNYFYYKSAASVLGNDEDLVNQLYNMVIDGGILQTMPPMALYGDETIDSSVMVPSRITAFNSSDTKLESLLPRTNLAAGLEMAKLVEQSMSESTQDPSRQGIAAPKEMTAYEFEGLNRNADVMLGLFGTMTRSLVQQIGTLAVGCVIEHGLSTDLMQLMSDGENIAFSKYVLPAQKVSGKTKDIEIRVAEDFAGRSEVSEKEIREKEYKLYEEGEKKGKYIYEIMPDLIKNYSYYCFVKPDALEQKSKRFEKAMKLELYDRAISNPFLDQAEITKEFLLGSMVDQDVDKFMAKQQTPPANTPFANPSGVNQNVSQQMSGSNSLKSLLAS